MVVMRFSRGPWKVRREILLRAVQELSKSFLHQHWRLIDYIIWGQGRRYGSLCAHWEWEAWRRLRHQCSGNTTSTFESGVFRYRRQMNFQSFYLCTSGFPSLILVRISAVRVSLISYTSAVHKGAEWKCKFCHPAGHGIKSMHKLSMGI